MTWVKMDDQFFRNPKVLRAGRDGRDLFLAGLCFCSSGLTDGHIPTEALRSLGAEALVDDIEAAAEQLVRVGQWEHESGGYLVHDYLEFNPSAEQVANERAVQKAGKHRRRAREKAAPGRFTAAEWRALCSAFGNRCLACGETRPLTPDHVVPLALGGTNGLENIQPLCFPCNMRKGARTIDYRVSA